MSTFAGKGVDSILSKKGKTLAALTLALALAFPAGLTANASGQAADSDYYNEVHRNQFHFSPQANWMNDPNGMIYFEGEYHQFFQYDPYEKTQGPMHWGHAVSKDLIHWEQLPFALAPDENGVIFSGSAVVDYNNTAGFGKNAMVAIFTHANGSRQVQSLAYSTDRGRTWTKYKGNPVMPNPPAADWRDPNVFWHEESNQWVMTLASKDRIMFYTSPNLKDWTYQSEFGPDGGIQGTGQAGGYSFAVSTQRGQSFVYEADVMPIENNTLIGAGGLVFRADPEIKSGYVAMLNTETDKVTLGKIGNDSITEIVSKPADLRASTTYHVKVKTIDERVKIYVDDKLIIDQQDSSFGSGYFGLSSWNSSAVFRNVKFTNTSNFVTNISGWTPVSGTWANNNFGKLGSSADDAYTMSGGTASDFSYETDLRISQYDGASGFGSLVFRADADGKNGYEAVLDDANNKVRLIKTVNGASTVIAEKEAVVESGKTYHLKTSAAGSAIKVFLNGTPVIDAEDAAYSTGLLGLHASDASVQFQGVFKTKYIVTKATEIENHDFETGDLTGWKIVRGDAFTNAHVSKATEYWGGPFGQQGNSHLWGAAVPPYDALTGELHSSYFKLSGSGEINLMIGGGNDINTRYVALVRASDDKELIRQENKYWADDEKYRRFVWDASDYVGEVLYIKVVDNATGGWGHINLDDVNVYNTGTIPAAVDNKAREPKEPEQYESGTITEWKGITGDWVPSTNGRVSGVWECPALFTLPVDGNPSNKKWVLLVSLQNGSIGGGAGMQYFIGNFDGKRFVNDNPADQVLWADYGADFYAGIPYNNIEGKNGERYWLAWMSNWQYAKKTPTTTWRSSLTLPREMELTRTKDGLRLKQTPVSLEKIRDLSGKITMENRVIPAGSAHAITKTSDVYEILAEFDISHSTASEFGFKVHKGAIKHGDTLEQTLVGYDTAKQNLFVDRSKSGNFNYGIHVKGKHEAPLQPENDTVKMHLFVDRSAIEVFGNNGIAAITDQVFPDPRSTGLEVYSIGGDVKLKSLDIYPLKSIWGKSPVKTNLSGWTTVNGMWADTLYGKQGETAGMDAITISGNTGGDSSYEADIRILDTDSHPNDPNQDYVPNPVGSGDLIFRSDRLGENAYMVRLDVRTNTVKLIKSAGGQSVSLAVYGAEDGLNLTANKTYNLKVVTEKDSIQVYLDKARIITVSDPSFTGGYFGLGVSGSTTAFDNIIYKNKTDFEPAPPKPVDTTVTDLVNPNFETGDLTGWTVVSGNAFSDKHVSQEKTFFGALPFNQSGTYHLWGYNGEEGGDSATGILKSNNFKLSGNGEISFLMGGGNDYENLYVALVRASDDQVLLKTTNVGFDDDETYRRMTLDASAYLGEVVYIKLVDTATGGWGHLNVDDFKVQ